MCPEREVHEKHDRHPLHPGPGPRRARHHHFGRHAARSGTGQPRPPEDSDEQDRVEPPCAGGEPHQEPAVLPGEHVGGPALPADVADLRRLPPGAPGGDGEEHAIRVLLLPPHRGERARHGAGVAGPCVRHRRGAGVPADVGQPRLRPPGGVLRLRVGLRRPLLRRGAPEARGLPAPVRLRPVELAGPRHLHQLGHQHPPVHHPRQPRADPPGPPREDHARGEARQADPGI
mmetsp:Transcript_115962/g.328631  ORF Transcript_115962/g.328631 Transcript_115962/m.328631 type:complete len:231 (+) Transcript_115962:268-960(+)